MCIPLFHFFRTAVCAHAVGPVSEKMWARHTCGRWLGLKGWRPDWLAGDRRWAGRSWCCRLSDHENWLLILLICIFCYSSSARVPICATEISDSRLQERSRSVMPAEICGARALLLSPTSPPYVEGRPHIVVAAMSFSKSSGLVFLCSDSTADLGIWKFLASSGAGERVLITSGGSAAIAW